MYISWLRSSKIHTSSNSCVRNRNSNFPWKQRRLPVVCLKTRPEWKQKSPTSVTMFITLAKKKTPGILKKITLHDHPQPRTSEVAVNTGFCFTSRSTSTRSALTPGSSGFREPLEVAMGYLDGFLVYPGVACIFVDHHPLFPCSLAKTTFDKRVKKMDASKSRWHLLSCYGDVLGGMERFGAILDSRDDILEWRLANLSGNPVLCHRSPQCFPCSCLALWWKPVGWIEVARIP